MYAEMSDVQARMPQFTLSATSKPSQQDAETFLRDAHAQVDATLENLGYVVPITGERSLSIVKGLTVALAIVSILEARSNAVGSEAATGSAKRAQEWYDARIEAIRDPNNPLELSDASRNNDRVEKPMALIGGLLVDEDGEDIEPAATMTMKF